MGRSDLPTAFIRWAEDNGVSLDHPDDWMPWYECWQDGHDDGYDAGYRDALPEE